MQLRSKIDDKYKWDLSDIIKDDAEIEATFKIMEEYINIIPQYKGKLNNKDKLYELLTQYEDEETKIAKLGFYLYNTINVDLTNTKILRYQQRYENLNAKISVASSFIQPELYELSDDYLRAVAEEARFKDYDNYFNDIIKLKPHKLNEHDNMLLSKMSKFIGNNSNIHSIMTDSEMTFVDAIDSKGKAHKVDNASYIKLLDSKDRTLKKNAFYSMRKGFKAFNKTFASIYLNDIETDKFLCELSKYPDLITKELFINDIPREVFDNIIKHTNENIPVMTRFIKALKKKLNIKDFQYYDLFQKNNISGKISIEKAKDMILSALAPLGEEYLSLVRKKLNDHSIDYLPNKDKYSGGYCSNMHGVKTIILMNYLHDYDSVSTLIHEMGHCINAEYFNTAQPKTKADITIFAAEIASTVNEILLTHERINNTKGKEQENYIYQFLEVARRTIFRQVLFSEFELYAHDCVEKDIPITYEELNKYYLELNKKYYAKACKVPDVIQYEWMIVPHFYNAYYVYCYATGLVAAICIAKKILDDNSYSERYIYFLKNGTNKPAVEVLKEIGIDMTTDEPYKVAFNFIKDYVDQYEKIK